MKTWNISPAASDHLNSARALAAMSVVIGHIRGLFFVPYADSHTHAGHVKAFYLLTSLGHEAVLFFFVLSGFFVSATVLRPGPSRWSAASYAIDRLSRLYVVLAPGLLLTALCDALSSRLPGSAEYFYTELQNFPPSPFSAKYNLPTFMGNLFFLQNSYVGTFGSNSPLWSLANEFWYYAAWPLLLLLFWGQPKRTRLLAVLLALAVACLISPSIWLGFPVWLLGSALHLLPRSGTLSKSGARAFSTTLALTSVFGIIFIAKTTSADFLVGLAFSAVTYTLLHAEGTLPKIYTSLAKIFADFSFSLYAIHFPILLLLRVLLWRSGKWQPGAAELCSALGCFVLVLLLAFLFSKATEAHTGTVRRFVHGWQDHPAENRLYN